MKELLTKDLDARPSRFDIINTKEMKETIDRLVKAGLTVAPEFRDEDFQLKRTALEEHEEIKYSETFDKKTIMLRLST